MQYHPQVTCKFQKVSFSSGQEQVRKGAAPPLLTEAGARYACSLPDLFLSPGREIQPAGPVRHCPSARVVCAPDGCKYLSSQSSTV
jgi:hypothetical protein